MATKARASVTSSALDHPSDPNMSVMPPRKDVSHSQPMLHQYLANVSEYTIEHVTNNASAVIHWARATDRWRNNHEAEVIGSIDFQQSANKRLCQNWNIRYSDLPGRRTLQFASVQHFCEFWLEGVVYFLAYVQELLTPS